MVGTIKEAFMAITGITQHDIASEDAALSAFYAFIDGQAADAWRFDFQPREAGDAEHEDDADDINLAEDLD
ncbi:hypothetical protein PK98_15185 [Croceibacterium mercuriale]|uniref:Uncharacterized protein n=1 Tax=Croceibacterium mercuriale TaxID=1572751 RepID=A0A0B2BXC1_9SPHN|nr:hypothetical protein [Croceibacterium mercuriale]KHL24301.1 hypothetical protein PK98_15185 [Croceibacterium mercuriale]